MKKNLIYGLHTVQAVLKRDFSQVKELWVDAGRKDKRIQTILSMAGGITIHRVSKDDLDVLAAGANHQGVIAHVMTLDHLVSEEDLERLVEARGEETFLLILDGVQDPHNLGACLRSADAAGVDAVIVPRNNAVSITATVSKVACGAAETVPFIQVTNLVRTLRMLKDAGVWLVGADGTAKQSLYDIDLRGALALIMGGEGEGLRRLTRENCDYLARLPMAGTVESLNVSVATGICLFEAVRQRS